MSTHIELTDEQIDAIAGRVLQRLQEIPSQTIVNTASVWDTFLKSWCDLHHDSVVTAAKLLPIAMEVPGFLIAGGSHRAQLTSLGMQIANRRGCSLNGHTITFVGTSHHQARYRLLPVGGSA